MIYKGKALAIIASVMLLGCLFLLSAKLNSFNIQKNGKLVTVRIIDVPKSCEESSGRNNAYFRFEYLGKIHIKDLITSQCDYVLSHKTIVLKTNNESSAFLFKDEDISSEIGAAILIMLFLVFCIFKGLRKKKLIPYDKGIIKKKRNQDNLKQEGMETKYDDSVLGRARVQDTPELEAYYKELEGLGAGALWTVANDIEPWEPRSSSVPMLWKYENLRELVLKSSELVTPEQAGRRVVYLVNDKRKDVSAAVGWLYTGIQVTRPGESTSAHRHKASALRFIMEGEGGYTIVDGNKIMLEVNDFVITPNSTWHEHGVEEGGKTCIWQDGLDIPLVNALEANDYAVYDGKQPLVAPVNHLPMTYGSSAGIVPADIAWNKPYSPLFKYSWKKVYPALLEAAKVNDGSPFDGILMHYTNPVTGGHVMQTMGASIQLLRAGEHTKAHKHTGSFVYQCAKGHGYSIINGKRFDWKERDIFCVPSWAYHEHVNLSETEDACLFSFNDLPVIQSLGLYQEKEHPDGYQKID